MSDEDRTSGDANGAPSFHNAPSSTEITSGPTQDLNPLEVAESEPNTRTRSSFRRSHRMRGASTGRDDGHRTQSLRDALLGFSKPSDEKGFARIGSPALPEVPNDFRSKTRASMSFMKSKSMMAASRPTFSRMLTNSFQAANPEMGYLARNILAQIFMPWGIFFFLRIMPALYLISAPLVIFCPAPSITTTVCGTAGSPGGLYEQYRIVSAIYLVFLGLMLVVISIECASNWIDYFDGLFVRPATQEFQLTLRTLFDVSQQDTTIREKVIASVGKDPKLAPPKRLWSRVAYILFFPVILCWSLIRLLLSHPTRLSDSRHYGDFEIFICFQTGTINGLLGIAAGVIAIVVNGGVSLFGYLLVLSASFLFLFAYLFSSQFAVDDERPHLSAILGLHFMPSRSAPLVDSVGEIDKAEEPVSSYATSSKLPGSNPTAKDPAIDVPLYRTVRYRQRLDYRNEGALKDFQILQLVNLFNKHCQVTELWFNGANQISTGVAAVFCAYLVSGRFEAIESINYLNVKELIMENALVISPDAIRSESLFQPSNDSELVPWNPEISWTDGLLSKMYFPTAKDSKLFPFLASVAMSMIDPFRLVEIDLGANDLTDESVFQITSLITKSQNLFLLELGGNKFGLENGIKPLVRAITNHESVTFVRLSTVLLNVSDLRNSASIDLSLPRVYASGIERVIQSVFEACMEIDSLRSDFFGAAKLPTKRALENHYVTIRDMISRDYRYLGRDFFRTVTPNMVKHVLERVAHRVGKYIVPDPGPLLDLSGDRAVDGLYLNTERSLLEEKLYLSLLEECDILLVCSVIERWNEGLEEIDFRGMPLVGDMSRKILEMLGTRKKIRTINFTGCGIRVPDIAKNVLNLLRIDPPLLREIGMRGNLGMRGQAPVILKVLDEPDRKSHPNVIIDQPVSL